jgi:hypothetical protein
MKSSSRIMALAEPPQTGTGKGQWLSPEVLSMFLFHHMRSLSHQVGSNFYQVDRTKIMKNGSKVNVVKRKKWTAERQG